MIRSRHFNRATTILLHIVAWVLFFSLPLLLHPPIAIGDMHQQTVERNLFAEIFLHPPRFDLFHTISDLLLVGIFYLNAYVLIPRLMNNKKFGRFLSVQALIFVGFALCHYFLFRWIIGDHADFFFRHIQHAGGHGGTSPGAIFMPPADSVFHHRMFPVRKPPGSLAFPFMLMFRNSFPYLLILASSIAYRLIIDRIRADRLAKERENENLKTELLLLRSQINPHFMFNVLNNMVSLARKKSDQLESSLIKLSSLMRYMYYEAREDKVSLSKEIEYLKSYIDIQEQRFQGSVVVRTGFPALTETYFIEPMLLIPFVENAFKHGTGLVEDAEININLSVINEVLCFFVSNKFSDNAGEEKDKTTGIGLANVKRRLNLLYGDRYQLEIVVRENWHTVSLQLNLI